MIRKIFSFFLLFFIATVSYGTHNLAGDITYRHISGLTYEFTFTIYADGNSAAIERSEIEVNWGDNTGIDSIEINTPNQQVASDPFPIIKRVWKATHTFPGPSFTYRISVEDPNRNRNVINMDNSVNVPFTIETELFISSFSGNENNSVQLRNEPIDRACLGSLFVYNPGAFDPDGTDSIAYELAPSKAGRDLIAPNFTIPTASNSFTIDPITGDLTWDVPTLTGIYNIAILITEYRKGFKVGSVLRDIQISVEGNCVNNLPAIFADQRVCVEAGKSLITQISSSDTDTPDLVTLTASGELLELPFSPRTNFVTQNAANPVNTSFEWNTICDDVRINDYRLNLRAEDNASVRGAVNLVNFKSINIRVISPGPINATAQANGKNIDLSWENIDCPNASGYYIYRRNDSSGFVSSDCITGVPNGIGYSRITSINDVNLTNFSDNNNSEGLIPGQKYCYLITKFYADGDESYASNEVCAEIEKIIPVITNVSISETSETTGQVELGWSPPETFDQIAFPAPYRYLIHDAFDGSLIGSTEAINDTTFTLNNLNTENETKQYRIELLSLGNGTQTIGITSNASSIFLSTNASDERVELSWSDNTPWNNNRYDIFRSVNGTNNYDSIGNSNTLNYTDSQLTNGVTYCYYIRSIGSYNLTSVINPIVNLSQENCATPIDNISPCSPTINLESNCENGFMRLSWNNLSKNCAPDLEGYRIYFSKNRTAPLSLLVEINNVNDTFYLAPSDSVGGCFTVTGVDSTGNESLFPTSLCAEYCPKYELPNVFTPNGDGKNDLFTPLKPFKYVDSIQINIYNRWGKVVFNSTNPEINWNGQHQNIKINNLRDQFNVTNSTVSSGVYFYVCEVFELSLEPTEPRIIKGTITVLDSQILQEKQ